MNDEVILEYLGTKDYKVDRFGNLYKWFFKPPVDESLIKEIKDLYYNQSISKRQLSFKFKLSLTRIYSIFKRKNNWIKIKGFLDDKNYKYVDLTINKIKQRFALHRLIWEAFNGQIPNKMEICHNDGNPSNNNLENLRCDTHQGNMEDKKKHGTYHYGEKVNGVKLKEFEILDIRNRYKNKETQASIAKRYNITQGNVCRIINRQLWKHI